jgi:hypothetical protein
MHVYEIRPRKDERGVDLISDVLPFGRLWYDGPNAISNAIGYAEHGSHADKAVIWRSQRGQLFPVLTRLVVAPIGTSNRRRSIICLC